MLDEKIKEQLKSVFLLLEKEYTLVAQVATNHSSRGELVELLQEVASCSPQIHYEEQVVEQGLLLRIRKGEEEWSPFTFRAVPTGHEFSSLVMALLNMDGKGKNIPDALFIQRIRNLKGKHKVKSYISLSCTNCPEVVQAFNLIAILNPNISHEIIDGALHQEEVEALSLQGVPSVFIGEELVHAGKASLSLLVERLEKRLGQTAAVETQPVKKYDVVVIGAGPAGASAAIYSARKGLQVAVIADRVGGQVKDTVGIENFISKTYTTGKELADALQAHLSTYPIATFEHRFVQSIEPQQEGHLIHVQPNETFLATAVIIATGAGWRKLNVPGETVYSGRGIAYCPHCDGPFYKDMEVAVVGGGNSGLEAAIDLSGICKRVTVVEFMEELKADKVLQDAAAKRDNIEIRTYAQVSEVVGDGEKVTALRVKDRATNQVSDVPLAAVFVQIGLLANTAPFKQLLQTTVGGEIQIDEKCRTNIPGIYAAGDVTAIPYKQIIIAMGEGAKAALAAYEDRIVGRLVGE